MRIIFTIKGLCRPEKYILWNLPAGPAAFPLLLFYRGCQGRRGGKRGGQASVAPYFFFVARWTVAAELAATAARMSCLKAVSLILSPSRKSMARRVPPSRLELKSRFGSSREAPRAKVSFTACL